MVMIIIIIMMMIIMMMMINLIYIARFDTYGILTAPLDTIIMLVFVFLFVFMFDTIVMFY